MKYRHEPLRVPERWQGQDRTFVIQMERFLDDIYNILGKANETIQEMQKKIDDLEERVTTLED